MSFANRARRTLIQVGKILPFALCFIIACYYAEVIYSLLSNDFLYYYDCTLVNAKYSFMFANYFEYNWLVVLVTTIISFAIETCVWNKLSVLYLALHLIFKQWASTMEFLPMHIIGLCLINIIICAILTYKGLTRLWERRFQ